MGVRKVSQVDYTQVSYGCFCKSYGICEPDSASGSDHSQGVHRPQVNDHNDMIKWLPFLNVAVLPVLSTFNPLSHLRLPTILST